MHVWFDEKLRKNLVMRIEYIAHIMLAGVEIRGEKKCRLYIRAHRIDTVRQAFALAIRQDRDLGYHFVALL